MVCHPATRWVRTPSPWCVAQRRLQLLGVHHLHTTQLNISLGGFMEHVMQLFSTRVVHS